MTITIAHSNLAGVFPVLPTPFLENGSPDVASLRNLVRYLVTAGVDGITYPGVASEFGQLTTDERVMLTDAVLDRSRRPCPAGRRLFQYRRRSHDSYRTGGGDGRRSGADDCRAPGAQDGASAD